MVGMPVQVRLLYNKQISHDCRSKTGGDNSSRNFVDQKQGEIIHHGILLIKNRGR